METCVEDCIIYIVVVNKVSKIDDVDHHSKEKFGIEFSNKKRYCKICKQFGDHDSRNCPYDIK